jgi:RNA recognition motif-containing protein
VNGKLTGKALWKDALKRVELQSVIWPQLQLSQPISQPIFSHIVPSNIINTAEASARAILNKNSPVQDPSYFHGFSPSLSRILCESHPAVATVKQRALGITPTFLRSPSSSWPAVAHAAEAIELSAGRHSQRSSSQWDVLGENVGITASGSKVKDSRPIVKDSGAHGLLHSNSSTSDSAQRYYLRVCGLRSCVSDDDVFCFFQKFSAIRDQIVSIKSSNSKTQLLFVSFKSFKDAERAKDELIAQKNLQIMNNSFVIEDEVLSQRRIESIIRNSQVQAPGSCTHFSLTSPRVKNEDISFSGSNSERSINVAHHCSDHGALSTRARVEDNASPNERHQHDASDRAQHKDAQSRVSHVRCRHFARGHCDNGANCRFSHDAATKPSETRTCIPREAPETVSKQLGSALQGSDSREKKRWRYIELHGLPRHCTEQDILALLTWDFPEFESKNCEIILTKFMDGSRTGHAYCRLAIEEALFAAVLQCRKMMGSHRVSVFQGSEDRFLEVASEESKASSAVPRAPSLKSSEQAASDSNGSLAHAVSEQVFLKMRGLPYSCTVHDIVDFFQGHSVDPDSVKFGSTSDGFTAWAGFPNLAQARRAMQEKQRKYVGHRYVDIVIDESRQGQRSRSQSDAHSSSLASSSAAAPAIDTVPINALDSRINHDKDVFVSPNFHSESTKQRDTDTASYGSRLPEAPVLNAAWGTPSNVLFLKNLPADCFAREISIVFQTIKGFLCARDAKILCRPVVFVEFDNVENCKAAIAAMQGKAVLPRSDQSLQIEFGKSSRNSRVRLAPGTSSSTMETGHPNEHREVQPLSSTASRRVEIEKSDVDRERPSVSHVEGPTSKKQRLHDSGQAITSTPDDDVSTRQVVRFVKTEGNPSDITKTDSTPLADSFGYATEAFASVASGGLQTKTAAALYKTPSGRETRTWCRYGHSCKSGSKCNFGHENVAQKLIRTVDLRQSIDSPSASHSASLETDMRSKLGSKSHSLNVPMS